MARVGDRTHEQQLVARRLLGGKAPRRHGRFGLARAGVITSLDVTAAKRWS